MRIESLGRMAVFCIPAEKWNNTSYHRDSKLVSELVDEFLTENYNGYNVRGPIDGKWNGHQEQMMEIKASFLGKDRIPKLQEFLADLCAFMEEQCIYLETGEDAFLVYPDE